MCMPAFKQIYKIVKAMFMLCTLMFKQQVNIPGSWKIHNIFYLFSSNNTGKPLALIAFLSGQNLCYLITPLSYNTNITLFVITGLIFHKMVVKGILQLNFHKVDSIASESSYIYKVLKLWEIHDIYFHECLSIICENFIHTG